MLTHVVVGLVLVLPMVQASPANPTSTPVPATQTERAGRGDVTPPTQEIRPENRQPAEDPKGGDGSRPETSPVPDPMPLALFGAGLVMLALFGRKRHVRGSIGHG